MPIQTTRVIEHNGFLYPYVKFSMSMSYRDADNGLASDIEGVINIRFIPYRILDNGQQEELQSAAYSELIFNVYEQAKTNEHLAQAMGAVLYGIQLFINSKDL